MKITKPTARSAGRIFATLLLLGLIALLFSACGTDTPQNTFATKGDVAHDQRTIFLLAMWPAIGVMIFVEVGIVLILLRFRRRRADEVPKQVHGNTRLEVLWTIVPAIALVILAVPMMSILFDVGRSPKADAFTINVTGLQWQWLFEYPDVKDANGKPITLAGDPGTAPSGHANAPLVHLPAGREIKVVLKAQDVIHSFAIPRIAGTRDAIPGHEEVFWIEIDEPGTLHGQCREFCGFGHAGMTM